MYAYGSYALSVLVVGGYHQATGAGEAAPREAERFAGDSEKKNCVTSFNDPISTLQPQISGLSSLPQSGAH